MWYEAQICMNVKFDKKYRSPLFKPVQPRKSLKKKKNSVTSTEGIPSKEFEK